MIDVTAREEKTAIPNDGGQPNYSELPADKWLQAQARKIISESERERADEIRVQKMVQMCRRFRGLTASDRFGIFENGYWLEHESMEYLSGANVFQALVRGAESSFTQARVRLDIQPVSNNYESRAVQTVAKGIYAGLVDKWWTEHAEAAMFYGGVLKLNYFLISRFNRAADDYKTAVPQYGKSVFKTSGRGICNDCDKMVEFDALGSAKCSSCGSESVTQLDSPAEEDRRLVTGYKQIPAGEVETLIVDGLQVLVDDAHGKPNDIKSAHFVEYRDIVHKNELKKLFPHLKLENSPRWTYSTQWKIALTRYKSSAQQPMTESDRQLYELREIWLDPCLTEDYVAPADYELGRFKIKQGQKLSDVSEHGICFGVVGEEIAFIYDENKDDVMTAGSWLNDAESFYGLGVSAGLEIQRKINQLENINMDGINRALRGALLFDSEAVDGAYLEGANTNIPLRPNFDRQGQPLQNFVLPLQTQGLSNDSLLYLNKQEETLQKIMGVPDAVIGEGDPNNKTATGQQQLTQRALGLLIPAKKSQAFAMEAWFLQQCRLIQKYYSPDRIREEFGGQFGETWLDDEIEMFLKSDLKKALMIRYVQGSEVPQTRQEKEAKLVYLLANGLLPPSPQVMHQITSLAGLEEFDISDYESNIQLAQKRWMLASEGIGSNPEVELLFQYLEAQMLDEETGERMEQTAASGDIQDFAAGSEVPNPLIEQALQSPEFKVNKDTENHEIHIDFWSDKVRDMTASKTSVVLMKFAEGMLRQHQQAVFELQTQQIAEQAAAAAPTQIASAVVENEVSNALAPPPEEPTGLMGGE